MLAGLSYDVVVVDEAHHLRDQSSASYRLVNGLQKRFLLLLSATPVQNSLLELYNLLTLLQPGIFKTQKEFRSVYMVPGKPREPANRERLRDLMRSVMVRNTRALAALRMPRRQASTHARHPRPDGSGLLRDADRRWSREVGRRGRRRIGCRCSICWLRLVRHRRPQPPAIARMAARHPEDARWAEPARPHPRHSLPGQRRPPCCNLLAQNPAEKKLVFVHHRDSMTHLADLLHRQKTPFAKFSGDMTGPQKDAAVAAFRDRVPVLLCTRVRRRGAQSAVLQHADQLRHSLESDGDRAAHRPDRPDRPDA